MNTDCLYSCCCCFIILIILLMYFLMRWSFSLFSAVFTWVFGIKIIPESVSNYLNFSWVWGLIKFSFYYGSLIFFDIFLITLIVGVVNEIAKMIFNYIREVKLIQKVSQINVKKLQALKLIGILLCCLLLLVFSCYLLFYFDSYFLRIPLIFYISYSLALGLSFPIADNMGFSGNVGRIEGYFEQKLLMNLFLVLGCFAFREVYLYFNNTVQ